MGAIRGFKDLVAWQKGMELAQRVYQVSEAFPARERLGLTAQVRRSAVSVPSNVAEGYGRRSRGDYVRFLHVADGSCNEVETQLLLAQRLGFAKDGALDEAVALAREEQRILRGLIRALQRSGG